MGLAEKKRIKSIEEQEIVDIKKSLNDTLEKTVDININWDTFETVKQIQEIPYQCLKRLFEGLKKIAADDMGKEALQESLTAIKINNISDSAAKKITLEDNVLIIDANWEDFGSGIFTPEDYTKQIENLL